MSKEDSARGGLLSKVVRFVRNPTVQWSELDAPEEDKDSLYSKQVLKEMIERKRRNDFVRRREFDQLRKIRRRELVQGNKLEDATGRTSFSQSTLIAGAPASSSSPDGRAVTLKKIDEIEAQMSQQWWRGKPTGAATAGVEPRVVQAPKEEAPSVTAAVPLEFAPTAPMTQPMEFAPTVPQSLMTQSPAPAPATADLMSFDVPMPGLDAVAPPEELEKFVHEPDLEEAAIRFANGDHEGAESGLLDVLARHANDDPKAQFDIWMTLFDLYRATGQQDRFDKLAIDFAGHFGRTAPLWFSMPERLGLMDQDAGATTAQREFSWGAPSILTQQSFAALLASLARKPPFPWTLNWSRITDMDESVIPAVADLFQQWADQPVEIKFVGVAAFNAMLQGKTPSGDRAVNDQWWRLRMTALRLMGLPDEFELVALDYCVTYEVSPPSWAPTKSSFISDDREVNAAAEEARREAQRERDLLNHAYAASRPMGLTEAAALPTLSGNIDGDAYPALQPFEAMMRDGVPLQVACDNLIRMDFPAAGSVLNWAAEQQAKGRVVQFINLHRLIAVFFNVIGVSEHAWVIARRN